MLLRLFFLFRQRAGEEGPEAAGELQLAQALEQPLGVHAATARSDIEQRPAFDPQAAIGEKLDELVEALAKRGLAHQPRDGFRVHDLQAKVGAGILAERQHLAVPQFDGEIRLQLIGQMDDQPPCHFNISVHGASAY